MRQSFTIELSPEAKIEAIGDLNGDGRADLLIMNKHKITAFLAGGGGFKESDSWSFDAENVVKVALMDYNYDGLPDLILTAQDG